MNHRRDRAPRVLGASRFDMSGWSVSPGGVGVLRRSCPTSAQARRREAVHPLRATRSAWRTSSQAQSTDRRRRSAAVESFRLAIIATAVIMVFVVVVRLSDTIGLVLFAASLAFVSDPVRRRLSRWIGRAPAIVVTALLTFVVIVGTAALLWRDLSGQSERLAELPGQRLDELRARSFPHRVAEAVGASDGVDAVFGRLPTTVITGRDSARGVGTQVIWAGSSRRDGRVRASARANGGELRWFRSAVGTRERRREGSGSRSGCCGRGHRRRLATGACDRVRP